MCPGIDVRGFIISVICGIRNIYFYYLYCKLFFSWITPYEKQLKVRSS